MHPNAVSWLNLVHTFVNLPAKDFVQPIIIKLPIVVKLQLIKYFWKVIRPKNFE